MATERTRQDAYATAEAEVLRAWGQGWRRSHSKSQQDLGRAAGYGSDHSPKSAAVAISRIESGKTTPTGARREALLATLGRSEEDLQAAAAQLVAAPSTLSLLERTLGGATYSQNEARRTAIVAKSSMLSDRVQSRVEESEQIYDRAHSEFVGPFLELAKEIEWEVTRRRSSQEFEDDRAPIATQIGLVREQTRISVLRALADGAIGVAAGVQVGERLAHAVSSLVSATATASTGTAIASLSGAAASRATLAWLGGGTLQNGGLGIAGGTALLAGVTVLPAFLAVGGSLVWKGVNLRREAQATSRQLDMAESALDETEAALTRAEAWHNAQQAIVQRAALLGQRIHKEVVEPSRELQERRESGVAFDLAVLPGQVGEALDAELDLLTLIVEVRAMPIWLELAAVKEPELDAGVAASLKESQAWIAASVRQAEEELDRRQDWLRSAALGGPR